MGKKLVQSPAILLKKHYFDRHETTVALLTRDNDERTTTNDKICRKEMLSLSSLAAAIIDVVPTNVLLVFIVQR